MKQKTRYNIRWLRKKGVTCGLEQRMISILYVCNGDLGTGRIFNPEEGYYQTVWRTFGTTFARCFLRSTPFTMRL